jgi:hypothetical protein
MLVTPAFGLIAAVKSESAPALARDVLAAPNAVAPELATIVPPVTLSKMAEVDAAVLEVTDKIPVERSVAV